MLVCEDRTGYPLDRTYVLVDDHVIPAEGRRRPGRPKKLTDADGLWVIADMWGRSRAAVGPSSPGSNVDPGRGTIGGVGVENSLWRAIAVFRVGAWAYVVYLTVRGFAGFERPVLGWAAVAGMGAWTAFATWGNAAPARQGWPMLTADLVVAGAALYASVFVIASVWLVQGAPTLPMAWVAAPVLAFAVAKGRRYAAAAAVALFAVDGLIRGFGNDVVVNGLVLLLLAGLVFGYLKSIAATAERRMQQATQLEAANRERERLARPASGRRGR